MKRYFLRVVKPENMGTEFWRTWQEFVEEIRAKHGYVNVSQSVGNVLAAARFILGKNALTGLKIIEVGFGSDTEEMHLHLLSRSYGADVLGIDIDPRAIEAAREEGYKAVEADLEHLAEVLPTRYVPDMIVSSMMYERAPIMFGEESNAGGRLGQIIMGDLDAVPEAKVTPEEAVEILTRAFGSNYQALQRGNLEVHITSNPLEPGEEVLRKIGYNVITHNRYQENFLAAPHLTLLQK